MTSFEAIRPIFPKDDVEKPIEGTFNAFQRAFKTISRNSVDAEISYGVSPYQYPPFVGEYIS